MRISDWSSDVCSSDLLQPRGEQRARDPRGAILDLAIGKDATLLAHRYTVGPVLRPMGEKFVEGKQRRHIARHGIALPNRVAFCNRAKRKACKRKVKRRSVYPVSSDSPRLRNSSIRDRKSTRLNSSH